MKAITIVIEVDGQYCGFGLRNGNRVKGVYLGYMAINLVFATINEFVSAWIDRQNRG